MFDYERLTVRDLKRIVNRGEATPAAIGLFVLSDYWEREHGRRAIVDNKLLRYIESKWQFTPYANELDYWLKLGELLKQLEYQALKEVERAEFAFTQTDKRIGYLLTVAAYNEFRRLLTKTKAADKSADENSGPTLEGIEELRENMNRLERYFGGLDYLPTLEEIEREVEEVRTYTANFLGYIQALIMALTLLGIPATDFVSSGVILYLWWVTERGDQFEFLHSAFLPLEKDVHATDDIALLLKPLTTIAPVRPSPKVIADVERALGDYLTPQWGEWARAGVSLRELAAGSRGVVDLIQNAGKAAAEVEDE